MDNKVAWLVSAPAVPSIWDVAYGATVRDPLRKSTAERVLPCIIEGKPFPADLVNLAIRRVSNRGAYKNDEQWLWEENLGVACALYKGYRKRHSNKEYKMALNENSRSRDYLYGRLLAIAEQVEEMAMLVADGKISRMTHAGRLMQRFSDQPFTTWKNIRESINPYRQRLMSNIAPLANAYMSLIDGVCDKFEEGDFTNNGKLSGEYLLGYHLQRKWLREHKLQKGQWVLKTDDDLQPKGGENEPDQQN